MTYDPDCYYGDHWWVGGVCSRCGKQLRCYCGRFVTVEGIDRHILIECPTARHAREDDLVGDE